MKGKYKVRKEANLQEADLRGADLRGADLREANLRGANLRGADLRGANLQWANLQGANLRGANLQEANLQRADLQGADLREANIDFACWPLWCGSWAVQIDEKIARQLLAHAFAVAKEFCPPTKRQKEFCNQFHRIASKEVPAIE